MEDAPETDGADEGPWRRVRMHGEGVRGHGAEGERSEDERTRRPSEEEEENGESFADKTETVRGQGECGGWVQGRKRDGARAWMRKRE